MAPKTARARRLGIALRSYREAAGLTLERAAEEINSTRSTLSRYENALSLPSPATVRALLTHYNVDGDALKGTIELAKEAKKPGWWVSYSYLLDRKTADFIALESEATSIQSFEPSLVPGLLQTPDYIRAIMRGGPHVLTDDGIEERVDIRLNRQKRLTATPDPLVLDAVIDEVALLRKVGGHDVWAEQLEHLIKISEIPHITIGVIPLIAGYHRGTRGSLHILEFGREDQPLASVETVAGQLSFDTTPELDTCMKIMQHLRTVALSPEASCELISNLLKGR
ncbi:helix-turn-helix domain-containing protein [Micromonospora sp. NBC_01796]|uniref:helix-turn-helix domain-containing protein n=1 Tax=Micromonospora sp. NBC_01796 TaxID=2975987 RepID=UPI002DDC59C3|nr:helix-turn-helix transcriptional regulator [Micromonospora sp. NBC_01796]WSA87140.1 helix-turn-helix domain-containing protein [Micromonospora sp. NBC_01796]